MNQKSKKKFTKAVKKVGLYKATNCAIPGEVFKERHVIGGRRVYGISLESLTANQEFNARKIV